MCTAESHWEGLTTDQSATDALFIRPGVPMNDIISLVQKGLPFLIGLCKLPKREWCFFLMYKSSGLRSIHLNCSGREEFGPKNNVWLIEDAEYVQLNWNQPPLPSVSPASPPSLVDCVPRTLPFSCFFSPLLRCTGEKPNVWFSSTIWPQAEVFSPLFSTFLRTSLQVIPPVSLPGINENTEC